MPNQLQEFQFANKDIVPGEMSIENKYELELSAMHKLLEMVPDEQGQILMTLWQEYETCETKEAQLCKDIDKFEMIQQCYEYEKLYGKAMPTFYESTRNKFKHPEIQALVEELYVKRNELNLQ